MDDTQLRGFVYPPSTMQSKLIANNHLPGTKKSLVNEN